eukprot:Opistho-1_new@68906
MSEGKRRLDDDAGGGALVKRQRVEDALVPAGPRAGQLIVAGPKRTSGLLAPIMLLTGHEGEVFSCKFNPSGTALASGSFDRDVFLWRTYGECENYAVLKGHSMAVVELHWSADGGNIFTASVDKTLAVWDATTYQRVRKLRGHTGIVNTCCPSRRGAPLIVSGSDDGTVKLWDARRRGEVHSMASRYPVTAACFGDGGDEVITGGIDNDIKVWDLRKMEVSYTMPGHGDTVTGLALSPDGSYVLSNSMDNTVRIWDVRPYAPEQRCVKVFEGAQHNFEKNLLRCAWSPDGEKVTAGSADRFVYVWDTSTRRILYKLPGHAGSVNEVVFHPKEPIVASCSSDKRVYIGELDLS